MEKIFREIIENTYPSQVKQGADFEYMEVLMLMEKAAEAVREYNKVVLMSDEEIEKIGKDCLNDCTCTINNDNKTKDDAYLDGHFAGFKDCMEKFLQNTEPKEEKIIHNGLFTDLLGWVEDDFSKGLFIDKYNKSIDYLDLMQEKNIKLESQNTELTNKLSKSNDVLKEVAVSFANWWMLKTPDTFKETDTIEDAFDIYSAEILKTIKSI